MFEIVTYPTAHVYALKKNTIVISPSFASFWSSIGDWGNGQLKNKKWSYVYIRERRGTNLKYTSDSFIAHGAHRMLSLDELSIPIKSLLDK